jgi:hypothetical protein
MLHLVAAAQKAQSFLKLFLTEMKHSHSSRRCLSPMVDENRESITVGMFVDDKVILFRCTAR